MAVPEEILNIGERAGQNHFNIGIGRASGHVDHGLSEIAAGFSTDPEFAAVDGGTWCRFSVRMNAKTTSSNTKYPRSELRELDEAGGKAAWDGRNGVHRMQGTSRVVHLPPKKPWAVFCQIHDANSDLIRVQTEGSSVNALKIVARNTPPGADDEVVTTVMPSYTLGQEITWRFEVTDGAGKVFLNDALALTFPAGVKGCYFKAGCYAQSNTKDVGEDPAEFAAIDVKAGSLRHWHTGWAEPEHASEAQPEHATEVEPEQAGHVTPTPRLGVAREFSVAFASCLKKPDSDAFTRIKALKPDYFAMLGDCWYEEESNSRDHMERWKAKFTAPQYSAMIEALPNPQIVGWSDHDFGFESNATGAGNGMAAKANAAYRAMFPALQPDLPATGIYRTWVRDRIRFILCDERTFKSPVDADDNAHKTVLGNTQKAWLKGLLADPRTPVVVIFGDVPWIGPPTNDDDGWKGYTTERKDLATAFESSPAEIIRCNGDMHCLAFTHDHLGVDRIWQAAPLNNVTNVKDDDGEFLKTFPTSDHEGPRMQAFGLMTFVDDGTTIAISCNFFGDPENGSAHLTDSLTVTAAGGSIGARGPFSPGPVVDAGAPQPSEHPQTPVTPAVPGAAVSRRFPADMVNLTPWKVTLPENGKVKNGKVLAKEVLQPDLAAFADEFFGLTDDNTGIRFRCFHGGFTTKNSDNPRSELREMKPDGHNEASWATNKGRHQLTVRGQVNRLTQQRPHVVIAQIHNEDDDVTVFRVEGRKLFVTNGDDTHFRTVTDALDIGTRYEIGFDVSGGTINYLFNGQRLPFNLKINTEGCYFKAGNYLQSNEETAPHEATSEFAEVVIFELTVSHTS